MSCHDQSPPARTYRGVAAADRQTQRRAKLLDATLDLWGDPTRPRVTMTAVYQRAGLTERYFYESFTHLDDALFAVLEAIAVEIEHTTVDALHDAGGDPTERVRASIAAFVQILTDDPRPREAPGPVAATVRRAVSPRGQAALRPAVLGRGRGCCRGHHVRRGCRAAGDVVARRQSAGHSRGDRRSSHTELHPDDAP